MAALPASPRGRFEAARICSLVALGLLATSCGEQPAPDYEPGVSAEDHDYGAQQHPKLLAEFGGEYAGPQQAYVRSLGDKLAAAAGLADQCTFTLVNSDVVNAFAVPGCYIYVTRGLMAIVDSEAELASVLGHEVGHIVARHSERQQSRSLWSTLGVIAISLTGSERLTRLAGAAAELFTMRYSRTQEYEADDLGVRYLVQAGYDPFAAGNMLAALGRNEAFVAASGGRDKARSIPEWASSHPLTDKRIERALASAEATGQAPDKLPDNKAAYLTAVDGLLYGDDPAQGFVIGRRFAHPVMRIGFEAPEGFTLTNSPQAIGLSGPDNIRGEFGGGEIPSGGLAAYGQALVGQLLGDTPHRITAARDMTVNGLPAIILSVQVSTRDGSFPLAIATYDGGGGNAYHFVLASPPVSDGSAAIDRLFGSFHLLSPDEVARLKAREIDVVTVGAGEDERKLARQVADPNGLALLRMLNGEEAARPGERVKVVAIRQR